MILAPSVLSLDYSKFNEQLKILNNKVKWIHFDVMDGHFVPNLSFGPDILKAFRKNSSLFMDVHLMVSDPDFFSDVFIKAGADGITFHYEAYDDIDKCKELIDKIKSQYVKVGISVKPKTDVKVLEPILKDVDLVLIMSVEPGFGGQSFMEDQLEKVKWLKEYKDKNNLNYHIEIDGGINGQTAYKAIDAGCDVLVAGSYVFKGDMEANIDSITFEDK